MAYRLLASCFLFLFCSAFICAQSPYELSTEKEFGILGGGAALFTLNITLENKMPPLNWRDTMGLSIMQVPKFDRFATKNWSPKAARTSDVFLRSSPLVPILLPLVAGKRSRMETGITYIIIMEGMLANYAVTEFTKLLSKRKRPYVYGRSSFDGELFTKNAKKSFFSGHASQTSVHYFLAAKMFSDFYPNNDWEPVVWTTAAVIPAFTAWKRVQAGKHFLSDVVVGYTVGALLGILIPEIHKKVR